MIADKLKTLVPPKEPVSLTNRTHTAGVHQGAVLEDASTYEAHPLDLFGVSENAISCWGRFPAGTSCTISCTRSII